MRQTTGTRKSPGEQIVKDIKRAPRKHYSSEEKIRIVLDELRGEDKLKQSPSLRRVKQKPAFKMPTCLKGNSQCHRTPKTHPFLMKPTS